MLAFITLLSAGLALQASAASQGPAAIKAVASQGPVIKAVDAQPNPMYGSKNHQSSNGLHNHYAHAASQSASASRYTTTTRAGAGGSVTPAAFRTIVKSAGASSASQTWVAVPPTTTASPAATPAPTTVTPAAATTSSSTTVATTTTTPAAATTTTTTTTTTQPLATPALSAIQADALASHNEARAKYGAAPLVWSSELQASSQAWANKCLWEHGGGTALNAGENLAASTDKAYTVSSAVAMWMAEAKDYNPADPVYSHFTQVAWKATTQLGCSVAQCPAIQGLNWGGALVVCHYLEAGNVYPASNFLKNVGTLIA